MVGAAERTRPAVDAARRVLRHVAAALVTGVPDPPPPRPAWLRPRMPRFLGLLPFRTLDLVRLGDLVLAVCLFIGVMGIDQGEPAPRLDPQWLYLTALAHTAPLALRQRWPLAAWRLSLLGIPLSAPVTLNYEDLPYTPGAAVTYLLCAYTVAVRCDRDVSIGVWGVGALVAWVLQPQPSAIVSIVLMTVAVLFGYNVRTRRSATSRLIEEEERADRERAGRAVLAERARIARELHDVVAHHMSVIAIQAEAVPLRAHGDPRLLEAGLAEIRELSLKTLAEMRRVLGVLRDESEVRDTAPQPGLDALEELLETSRAAGLNVSAYVTGTIADLPEGVSLSAYRIVQESLSNAMRHAPGASVTVRISREPAELRLRVVNGPGRPQRREPYPDGSPDDSPGGSHGGSHGGQGLIGMRERAAMLGGTLEAGPDEDGGFAVTATLPIAEGR